MQERNVVEHVIEYNNGINEDGFEIRQLIDDIDIGVIQFFYEKNRMRPFYLSKKFFDLVGYTKEEYYNLQEDYIGNKIINREDLVKIINWVNLIKEGIENYSTKIRITSKSEGVILFTAKITCRAVERDKKIVSFLLTRDYKRQVDNKYDDSSLFERATKDSLTGLYNKFEIENIIDKYLKAGYEASGAFIMLDIDDFKEINDNLGHIFGDETLIYISGKLKELFSSAYIGRVGGDEMILFFPGTFQKEEILKITEEISAIFKKFHVGDIYIPNFTCSLGISVAPEDGKSFSQLYEKADKAMYVIKNSGKFGAKFL